MDLVLRVDVAAHGIPRQSNRGAELRVAALRIAEHGAARPSGDLLRLERERRRVEAIDAQDRGVEIVVEEDRDRVERLPAPLDPGAPARDHVCVRQHQLVGDDEAGPLQDLIARRAGDQHERWASVPGRLGRQALGGLADRIGGERRQSGEDVREPDHVEDRAELRRECGRRREGRIDRSNDGGKLQGTRDRGERTCGEVDPQEPDRQDEGAHRQGGSAERVRLLEARTDRAPMHLGPEDRPHRVPRRPQHEDRAEPHGCLGQVGTDEIGGQWRDSDADEEPEGEAGESRHLEEGAASVAAPGGQCEQQQQDHVQDGH
jgi:hypothetical protein